MTKILLLTFESESDTDIGATFDLQKIFLALPESDLKKFEVFHSVEKVAN